VELDARDEMTVGLSRAILELAVGATILVALWWIGVAVERLVPALPFPPSVTGMVLLWISLERGWIPERSVRRAARLLVRYLGLLFVPIGVGIVAYLDLVRENLVVLVLTLTVGTVVAMAVTATVAHLLDARQDAPRGPRRGTPSATERSDADGRREVRA
jgi:holin-like protein